MTMEFKCANCLQSSSSSPNLLCCFHVFCKNCLSHRISSDQLGRLSLTCPICHLVTFVPESSLPTMETSYCQEHQSADLQQYCETCLKVICVECAAVHHCQHTCKPVYEVFPAHKAEIEAKLIPLSDKFASVSQALVQVESQSISLSSKEKAIEAGIHNMIGMIRESLEGREDQLCDELHTIARDKLDHLVLQKDELVIIQAQLSSCLGFIREGLRSCSQQKVMMMKSTLLDQVEALLKEGLRSSSTCNIDDFSMKLEASPQRLMEEVSGFGRIVTPKNLLACCSVKPIQKSPLSFDLAKLLVMRLGTPLMVLSDLKGPCGVAVTHNGEVVVAEGCAGRISIFSTSGKKLRSFGKCGTAAGDFTCPCELDIDHKGNILIVDGSNRCIQKFTANGEFLASVGASGTLQFSEPDGISVHPINKKIYIVDNNTHRVLILNPDLSLCDVFGKEGSGKGYLRYPWGIACSSGGEVYVTDSGNCCVQVFTPEGHFLRSFGKKGISSGELKWPTGISVSEDGSIVYVSDYGNHRVLIYASSGQYLRSVGSRGKRVGEFGNIRGISVARNGLVYVCDTDNNRVVIY